MSSGMGGWGVGGVGTTRAVTESEILWGSDHARNGALWQSVILSGAMRDAVNSPTTVVRPGMLFGKLTSGGKFEEWDADAADGTQYFGGILDVEMRAQDYDANNTDREFRLLVARAPVKARKLLIQGAAFIGHADEYLARKQLVSAGFVLDDDPQGYLAGLGFRFETVTGTSDTLTASQNGMTLFYSSASAVGVTLPALQPGLEFTIVRTADEEIVVSSAAGNDIIAGGDASASSVTWTTAGQQIGAVLRIRSMYVSTTLKWIAEVVPTPYSTGAFLASSFS